jgi:hypothetical protein
MHSDRSSIEQLFSGGEDARTKGVYGTLVERLGHQPSDALSAAIS